jgi:hypothetical protein
MFVLITKVTVSEAQPAVTITEYVKPQFAFKKTSDIQGEKLRNYWLRKL